MTRPTEAMRPELFRELLPFDEALNRTIAAARPVARTTVVPVTDAPGRVAAVDVTSSLDVPPFDRAAMDGYAVRAADTTGATADHPVVLECIARTFTGEGPARRLEAGECVEVATGAPIPAGADAVVMVERTSRAPDGRVLVHETAREGQHIGRRGTDIERGHVVIRTGDFITAARAGAIAATGRVDIDVYDRPRVAILTTGNEVVPPGQPLAAGQVYDINRITLAAIVRQHGGTADILPIIDDDVDAIVEALRRAAATADLVVTSGGSSVGGRDLLLDALDRCGRIVYHGIAVKPGKPTLFGFIGETPLLGLPGNPASCLSNAVLLLVPFLRQTARLPVWRPLRRRLPLARSIRRLADRHQFYTVRIAGDLAEPAFKSSGDITSMATADGFIEVAAGAGELSAGESVDVMLF